MMKKIVVVLLALVMLLGYAFIRQEGYIINESYSESWKFAEGKLLFKGEEEEIKYAIEYIGDDELQPSNLVFEFLICPKNNQNIKDIDHPEHLFSNVNIDMKEIVNDKFLKEGSWKGDIIDSNKEYYFENLFLKISYNIDGTYFEEVLELPMEKI